ncbi:MAG: DMT family transporter [Candidatus Lokiarchaeota archaeon]|nr:DMT family transporter [Candidatus Lokiarchaeota archaeon]
MPEVIGYIFTLDALFTWALASLVYKYALAKTKSKASLLFRLLIVTGWTFFISLILGNYSFISLLNEQQLFDYLLACLISGLSVTIGDLLYFISLQKIDASRAYPLTQLSLVFVYPFAFFFFGEVIKMSILLGGALILSSVFILSSKDAPLKELSSSNSDNKPKESLFIGILCAVGCAFLWALAIVSFNQARVLSSDVFVTNFIRVGFGASFFLIVGIFDKRFYSAFKSEEKKNIKYYFFVGLAGSLSLGFADSLFYKAAEINGLVLTSTFTANTPMVQQIFSILFLKEKFRKRFIFAVALIIIGNYIIIFL